MKKAILKSAAVVGIAAGSGTLGFVAGKINAPEKETIILREPLGQVRTNASKRLQRKLHSLGEKVIYDDQVHLPTEENL